MISELDPNLIHNFRKKVHDHNNFVRIYFADYKDRNGVEGKDVWSKVCSCMDWLTVAVEGITIPQEKKNMNLSSLEFTHFLVTIDMIVESVNHLWLSIGEATKIKQPYLKDKSIFQATVFDREYTDETYVKELRSWFGVHAVNGNKVKLDGFNEEVRFFSSWSGTFNEGEFSVQLYSNNRRAEKKYGGRKKVRIDSLIKFVKLRYNTLFQLMDEIDNIYLQEKVKLQDTPVEYDKSETDLNQLKQLYQQAKDRKLTSEYYECHIEDYISFLSCDLNEFKQAEKELIISYLEDLKPIIPIYQKVIQDVEWIEHDIFELLSMQSQIYFDHHYDFGKVLEYAGGTSNSFSGVISLKILIEEGILPPYSMNLTGPSLSLLLHAIDHDHIKKYPREVESNFANDCVEIIDDISEPSIIIKVKKERVK